MDFSGYIENGAVDRTCAPTVLPVDFNRDLAMNENALEEYTVLTEYEKEKMIMKNKDSKA